MEELLYGRRYRTIEKIGTGGMADVYRAVDEVLGRPVAVKVMHARLAAEPEFAARFRQEAQAAANLVSPNIVNMYDWGQDDDTYYIVMEYVRGSDLKTLEQKGALSSSRVADVGAQVCSALSVAHGYDIIHRDIKPHNIMVQPDGAVKVMDFGIARAGNTTMTQTGSGVLGTAQYLSPEQAQGKPLTAASDLYSLGVVLYEAATGRLPFDADTPVAVALMHVNEEAVPPHMVNPDIDPSLAAVIVKAMQKKTADRYVSADDLRSDLRAVAEGRSVDEAVVSPVVVADAVGVAPRTDDTETTVISRTDGTAVMPRTDNTAVMPVVEEAVGKQRDGGGRPETRAGAQRRPVWPWILLAVLLVIAGLGVASSMGLIGGGRNTAVPDVRSKTLVTARTALQDAGLTAGRVTKAFSDSVKAGMIISQSPTAGATAQRSSAVNVVISKGPEMIAVPALLGMTKEAAIKALKDAGFSPQELPSEFNNDVPANIVFYQEPAGNAKAVKGSVVKYVVSRGADRGNDKRGRSGKPKG